MHSIGNIALKQSELSFRLFNSNTNTDPCTLHKSDHWILTLIPVIHCGQNYI